MNKREAHSPSIQDLQTIVDRIETLEQRIASMMGVEPCAVCNTYHYKHELIKRDGRKLCHDCDMDERFGDTPPF